MVVGAKVRVRARTKEADSLKRLKRSRHQTMPWKMLTIKVQRLRQLKLQTTSTSIMKRSQSLSQLRKILSLTVGQVRPHHLK